MRNTVAGNWGSTRGGPRLRHRGAPWARLAALALAAGLLPAVAGAQSDDDDATDNGKHCSATARATFRACGLSARADELIARAKCFNVTDAREREICLAEAEQEGNDAKDLCREQRDVRREICAALGEARYEPDFDPDNFDPDFVHPVNPNRFFPLGIGNRWTYRSGASPIAVQVLNQTKKIEGVTCVVVNDRVSEKGVVIEDTDDWFAQGVERRHLLLRRRDRGVRDLRG